MQLVGRQPKDPGGHLVEGDGANKIRQLALKVQQPAKGPGARHGALGNGKPFGSVTLEGPGNVVI